MSNTGDSLDEAETVSERALERLAAHTLQMSVQERSLVRALDRIAKINLGPDRASAMWRAEEAAQIASDALAEYVSPASGPQGDKT